MEIDFLGLNSKDHSSYNLMKNQNSTGMNPIIDSGFEDVSLSLRTTSPPLDSQTDELPYFNKQQNESFHKIQQVGRCGKIVVNASLDKARKCNRGHTTTVAMARKATLARFLQKRSHRLTRTRAAHFLGISLDLPEVGDIICHNKKNRSSFMV